MCIDIMEWASEAGAACGGGGQGGRRGGEEEEDTKEEEKDTNEWMYDTTNTSTHPNIRGKKKNLIAHNSKKKMKNRF